ncbi:DHA2 family multidrug resistance protein [Chitinophaga niastensis]|uniref:DHA2 family multidrug resistance protein n=1 Tax=Chitinophaga niastensis TaxID=536980 RepID=A0A2P8HDA1_CHINA|nr:DHA2 family efflux MFS transporter permease subunit [Chitinophaga niastensis]PSL44213.1 DHA2 family multidrug resistance protein [Chitinophaga niastensis]
MKRSLLIITVIMAAIMELIDTSIVNVALSHMSGNLGATLEDSSWVITAYAIANVIIIPMTSFLADKLGRRNYYIGSVIAFTFFSLMCGQASNILTLVIFRFLQGIGGGALLSVSQVIVFEQFPKEKQNVAGALFGIGVFVGPTIGPTLGGYITEYYSWPWIFYINVPIGILVAFICYILLREPTTTPPPRRIDWIGILLLAIGVSALQIVLERGETEDWFETTYITWLTAVAIAGIILFIWWELHTTDPVVNLRVLKSKNLAIAAVLTFISGIGMFSSVFLTPVFAQRLLQFSPLQTGLLLLPGACLAILGLIISARLLQSGIPPVILIGSGMLLFILFNWQMSSFTFDVSASSISTTLIWRGIGLAILTVPLTTLAISSLAPADIGQGAALNNMMRQLGGSFGIAMVNTYLVNRSAVHRSDLITHLSTDNPQVTARLSGYARYFLNKGATVSEAHNKALKLLDNNVIRQTTLLSFNDAYLLIGIIFLIVLPLLLLASGKKNKAVKVMLMDH